MLSAASTSTFLLPLWACDLSLSYLLFARALLERPAEEVSRHFRRLSLGQFSVSSRTDGLELVRLSYHQNAAPHGSGDDLHTMGLLQSSFCAAFRRSAGGWVQQ